MKKPSAIFSILLIFIFAKASMSQYNPDSLQTVINRIVKQYVDSNKAGLMVGIIRKNGDSAVYERFYSHGHIRVDTASPRPDSLTIFQLGSVTKSFTATILSMLIQQGGPLNVNDLVRNHIPLNLVRAPVYIASNGDTIRMTILDLATHYSALPDDPITPINDTTTYQMMYDYLNSKTLSRPPGECYLYSNLGVSFLGVVVTNTLGNIIDSLFIQKICSPLNMPDTRITLTPLQRTRLAQGYNHASIEGPYHKPSWPAFDAAGGLYTTTVDFMKYLEFQMGLSNLGMQNVLDSAHRMRRIVNDTCANPNSEGRIGLVWQMNILNAQTDSNFYFTWKDGGTAAFSSYICFADNVTTKLKTGVIVLSNHLTPPCDKLGVEILRYLNSDPSVIGISQISNIVPEKFNLYQNYPNPFNPSTRIKFDVPAVERIDNPFYRMTVYNTLGKEILILVSEKLQPGSYEVNFNATNLPSGVYFYKLTNGSFAQTKKMFLLK
jgi:CubicO group peptidase (beta-lactamase class C family)